MKKVVAVLFSDEYACRCSKPYPVDRSVFSTDQLPVNSKNDRPNDPWKYNKSDKTYN